MRLHRFAVAVAATCFLLLLVGGLVHNTGSGLACGTDWPRCHGTWIPEMKGGVLVEHGHRLLAGATGLCTLTLALWLFVLERRRGARTVVWMAVSAVGLVVAQLGAMFVFMGHGHPASYVPWLFGGLGSVGLLTIAMATTLAFRDAPHPTGERRPSQGSSDRIDARTVGLALTAVGLVVAQGLLGALTVQLGLSAAMSTAHLAVSILFFIALVALAVQLRPASGVEIALPARTRRLAAIGLGLVYVQMVLGALVRHLGAGLLCGAEFPLCRGTLWPEGAHYAIYLHIAHRALAFVVAGHLVGAAFALARAAKGDPRAGFVRALAVALPLLVTAQIVLGILSVLRVLDATLVTAHLGVAAALVADLVVLLVATRSAESRRP